MAELLYLYSDTVLLRNMINNNNSKPRPQHNYCTASYLIFVYSILNIFNKEFLLTDLDRLFLEEPELEKDSSD